MNAVLIIVAAVVVIAAVLYFALGRGGAGSGGYGLKRRFGPEYQRAVARHNGDSKAAERELRERVKRHGTLKARPLPPGAREQYEARWAEVQARFVDSPQQAVSEADALLARLAKDRGFPDETRFDEQIAALSVHHAEHIHGYRSVHAAIDSNGGTEEMRRAMVEARGLFDALLTERRAPAAPRSHASASPRRRGGLPWAPGRRHPKGSSTS